MTSSIEDAIMYHNGKRMGEGSRWLIQGSGVGGDIHPCVCMRWVILTRPITTSSDGASYGALAIEKVLIKRQYLLY